MARILLLCLSIIVLISMVHTSAGVITVDTYSGKGDPTAPYSLKSRALINENVNLLQKKPFTKMISSQIEENSRAILKLAPLSQVPFLHEAYSEILRLGELKRTELLAEANRRNPRDRTVLKFLIQDYIVKADYVKAIESLNLLYLMEPDTQQELIPFFTSIYQTDSGKKAIGDVMATKPEWGRWFLASEINRVSNYGAQYEHITTMVSHFIGDRPLKADEGLLRGYFLSLINLGRPDLAYSFWQRVLVNPDFDGVVYNGNFERDKGFPPFNWNLFYTQKAGAEYDGQSGLYIFHNNGVPNFLAQQYFPIKSDRNYTVKVNLRNAIKLGSSEIKLRFICRPSNKLWSEMALIPLDSSKLEYTKALPNVPDLCSFIELQLWAYPGQKGGHSSNTINSIQFIEGMGH